jgi:ketosteroid isomerase-like protein
VASSNLDRVRSIHAAWERGDYVSADWAHREIEFAKVDGPDPGTWHGVGEMARSWYESLSAWAEFRSEGDEYRELDAERVLVLTHFWALGKTSGLEVGQASNEGASLFQFQDGKVLRLALYWDRERAFADLGLTAEDGSSDTQAPR